MTGERDRSKRAGSYVLGLMDEEERERAERDLELDPAFRDAVLQMAERAHVFDLGDNNANHADEGWNSVLNRISGLPQMQGSARETGANFAPAGVPVSNAGRNVVDTGASGKSAMRGLIVALGLILMFALGYLAGKL
jgi:hypothetical protein